MGAILKIKSLMRGRHVDCKSVNSKRGIPGGFPARIPSRLIFRENRKSGAELEVGEIKNDLGNSANASTEHRTISERQYRRKRSEIAEQIGKLRTRASGLPWGSADFEDDECFGLAEISYRDERIGDFGIWKGVAK